MGREEQTDFNGRVEKTVAWLQEVTEVMTCNWNADKNKRLVRAGVRTEVLPEDNYVRSEPEVYQENLALFLNASEQFNLLHEQYAKTVRYNRQLTLPLEQCQTVLKRLSQLRLSLSYIIEEVSAHEENIRFDVRSTQRRMLKSLSNLSSLKGVMSDKMKAFEDARIDLNGGKAKKTRVVNPLTLSAKEFALHLMEQKSHSTRLINEKRVESPVSKPDKPVLEDKYSNVSHLYMDDVWRKGVNLKKPSPKYRLLRESRAARVLDRALNSKNLQVANSVRLLMAERPMRSSNN